MNWIQIKPAIGIAAALLAALSTGLVTTKQERGRGEVRARVAATRCDSSARVAQARVDSIVRVVEIREIREGAAISVAAARGRACNCSHEKPAEAKRPSLFRRAILPVAAFGVGIAVGHSWAPRAVETVVNVIGDGGDDHKHDGHYHGHRWYKGKHHRKNGGHDKHGRKDD